MDHDEGEAQPQDCQNLSDIQNYLVTFNKEIERGDTPQFQTVSLSQIPPGPAPVGTEAASVQNVTYDTVYYDDQSLLPADPNDGGNIEGESIPTIQSFIVQSEQGEGETTAIKLEPNSLLEEAVSAKQEVSVGNVSILDATDQLSAVHAQIAQLSGSGEVHVASEFEDQQSISSNDVRVPEGVITMSTNAGNHTVRMVTMDAAEAMSRMQEGTVEVDISQLTGGALQQVAVSQGSIGQIQQIIQADGAVHNGDHVAMLASVASGSNDALSDFQGITISEPELHGAQLVALQSSDGSQPQLVAVQAQDGSGTETVQVVRTTETSALGNGQIVLNSQDNNYQAVTIVPSEVSQGGEVSYYLIVPQSDGESTSQVPAGDFPMFDFARDAGREILEEIIDDNGTTRKIIRLKMPGSPSDRNAQLMCHYCNYTSPKRYLLTRHLKTHSQDRPHKCGICSRGFKTLASLQNHVNTHTGTRPHKCRECESSFTTSGELVRHVRYRHSFEKPHKCTECDYASVELSKLKRHMRSHTGERPYRCPNCAYASPDAYKLKRHLRIHTGEKPYECDICNTRFTQSNSLKAHRLIHSGNKPVFQCELCPTTCGRKTDLKIHMQKLHTAEEPLICKKCMQTFPDRYQFKVHLRTHEGEKCFKCQECEYAALSQRHLDSHKLTHSGEKPFRCESCGQAFRQKQLLRRHKNLYHTPDYEFGSQEGEEQDEDKVLFCSECDRTFASHGNLMKHMIAHKDSPGKVKQADKAIASGGILHKNIRAEIQEGRLTNQAGKTPHVVIVHLDGTIEEVMPGQSDIPGDVVSVVDQEKAAEELVTKALEKLQSGITEAVASATSEDIDQAAEMSLDGTVKVICVGGVDNTETALQVPADIIKARLEASSQENSANFGEEEEDEHQDAGTQVAFESDSEDGEEISIPGVTKLPPDSETVEDTARITATYSNPNSVLHLAKVAESLEASVDLAVESDPQVCVVADVTGNDSPNKANISTEGTDAEDQSAQPEKDNTLLENNEVVKQIDQSVNKSINEIASSDDVESPFQASSKESDRVSPMTSTGEAGEGELIGCPSPEIITAPTSSGEPEMTVDTPDEKKDYNIPDTEQAEEGSPLNRKRGRPPGKRVLKVVQQPKPMTDISPTVSQLAGNTNVTPPSTPTSSGLGPRRMSTRSSPLVNQSVTPNKQPQPEDKSLRLSGRKRKAEIKVEVISPVKRSRRLEMAAKQTGAGKK